MKRTVIVLCVMTALTLSAKAQKGSWYVGGNVGLTSQQDKAKVGSTTSNTGKETTWAFSPEFGTFLTNHVQLGLGLTLGGQKTDDQASTATVTTGNSLGATIYSRYFFGNDAFKPFVGLNVSAAPGKGKQTLGTAVVAQMKTFEFGANVNAGFGYAVSKKVTAVGSFGFLGFKSKTSKPTGSSNKTTSTSFGLDAGSLGQRFNVGFYYTL